MVVVHFRWTRTNVAVGKEADVVEGRRKTFSLLGERLAEGSVGDEAVTPTEMD